MPPPRAPNLAPLSLSLQNRESFGCALLFCGVFQGIGGKLSSG